MARHIRLPGKQRYRVSLVRPVKLVDDVIASASEVKRPIPKMTAAENAEFWMAAACYFGVFAAMVGAFSYVDKIETDRLKKVLKARSSRE